jgi:hypothetical protein
VEDGGVSDFITDLRNWLPTGNYLFKGGPADVQRLPVNLRETNWGMGPPTYWRIKDNPRPVITISRVADAPPVQDSFRTHTYKFVPVSHWNEGYYEVVK